MPLELAVGLIGLIGALLGAAVAGIVTFFIAKWQAQEQLRLARVSQLDARMANVHGLALTLTFESAAGMANRERFSDLLVESGVAQSMADRNWPHTSKELNRALMGTINAINPEVSGSGKPTPPDALTPAQLSYRQAMFAVYALSAVWLAAPEQFEAKKTSLEKAVQLVNAEPDALAGPGRP